MFISCYINFNVLGLYAIYRVFSFLFFPFFILSILLSCLPWPKSVIFLLFLNSVLNISLFYFKLYFSLFIFCSLSLSPSFFFFFFFSSFTLFIHNLFQLFCLNFLYHIHLIYRFVFRHLHIPSFRIELTHSVCSIVEKDIQLILWQHVCLNYLYDTAMSYTECLIKPLTQIWKINVEKLIVYLE